MMLAAERDARIEAKRAEVSAVLVSRTEAEAEVTGMRCPKCRSKRLRAWTTRKRPDMVIRVRICEDCDERVNTVERICF